jgi:hypothetical protein
MTQSQQLGFGFDEMLEAERTAETSLLLRRIVGKHDSEYTCEVS